MRFTLVIVALVAFCAVAAFAATATREAMDRCEDIGRGGGCSGCENPRTGCEWCTMKSNEADFGNRGRSHRRESLCAPKGACWQLSTGSEEFVSGGYLCPADFKKEPRLKGKNMPIPDGERFSLSFNSHYCEFPSEPWTVDRFSQAFRNAIPGYHCQLYNTMLPLGQRADVEELCQVDLDSPRVQECLRRFTEFQCSAACPGYGTPTRFGVLCNEHCASLRQVCNIPAECGYGPNKRDGEASPCTLYQCLESQASMTGGVGFNCAEPEDEDCDDIKLIPTGGQFDYDYCFFGDPKRCSAGNCQVEESTSYGSNLGDYVCEYIRDKKRSVDAVSQCTPVPPPNAFVYDSLHLVTTSWRITQKPTAGGDSCYDVVAAKILSKYDDVMDWSIECDEEQTECTAFVFVDGDVPGDVLVDGYSDLCFPPPIACFWDEVFD